MFKRWLTLRNPHSVLTEADLSRLRRIQGLRVLLICLALSLLNEMLPLGVSLAFLLPIAAAATWGGASFAATRVPALTVAGLLAVGIGLTNWILRGAEALVLEWIKPQAFSDFALDNLLAKLSFSVWCAYALLVLGLYYWRIRWWHQLELLLVAAVGALTLAAHRNFQLDTPKQVAALAWALNLSPQTCLLLIGAALTLLLTAYSALSYRRPIFSSEPPTRNLNTRWRLREIWPGAALLVLLTLSGAYFHQQFEFNLSRATNGVGQGGGGQGQSPLGFHSATGKTKQPAALVRLEDDYPENPSTPMLYLREGALSEFNGHELVIAGANFDQESPALRPGQHFTAPATSDTGLRKKIKQSVYLLAKHTQLFALDQLQALRPIKNPAPDRFEAAYQAISLAPTPKLQDLGEQPVGDTTWDRKTWAHYLRAPGSRSSASEASLKKDLSAPLLDQFGEDLRYRLMSQELTNGMQSAVFKAALIANYLSKTSIYTRQPGHAAAENADPVAPYLFGEKRRGYCVHFAHAAVYLMRLAGIPARIGTGYLTDLRFAKDGHILLHLGDRHAWPEIFVQGLGWVVVDVTPTQAENEPELVPDENLLEELMSKLNPTEEFLLPETKELPEEESTQPKLDRVFNATVGKILLLLVLSAALFCKLWLRCAYRLPASNSRRLRRSYLAALTQVIDLGQARKLGETRRELAGRLQHELALELQPLTIQLERLKHLNEAPSAASLSQARDLFSNSVLAGTRKIWRILSWLNPRSLFFIGKW